MPETDRPAPIIIEKPDATYVYTTCPTPYRNGNRQTPEPEPIVDIIHRIWSPKTLCNAYDKATGNCRAFERIESAKPRGCNRALQRNSNSNT